MKLIKMTIVVIVMALTMGACSLFSKSDKNVSEDDETQEKTITNNKTFTVNDVKFTMVKVEGGTFTMGASGKLIDKAEQDEYPAHKVKLASYYLGQTEVTQELWVAVMGDNPSQFKGVNLPVENVNWNDCQEFLSRLNNLTGEKFRLPTEAEWEYAARGGNLSKDYIYSGSDNLFNVAWWGDNSDGVTHPVATKQANELGIYDMSGNVWEWCNDWLGDYNSSEQANPVGPSTGGCRVTRGGSFAADYVYNGWRVSDRNCSSPEFIAGNLGFRLAL